MKGTSLPWALTLSIKEQKLSHGVQQQVMALSQAISPPKIMRSGCNSPMFLNKILPCSVSPISPPIITLRLSIFQSQLGRVLYVVQNSVSYQLNRVTLYRVEGVRSLNKNVQTFLFPYSSSKSVSNMYTSASQTVVFFLISVITINNSSTLSAVWTFMKTDVLVDEGRVAQTRQILLSGHTLFSRTSLRVRVVDIPVLVEMDPRLSLQMQQHIPFKKNMINPTKVIHKINPTNMKTKSFPVSLVRSLKNCLFLFGEWRNFHRTWNRTPTRTIIDAVKAFFPAVDPIFQNPCRTPIMTANITMIAQKRTEVEKQNTSNPFAALSG